MGIDFYKGLDGGRLVTSTVQMFDERGEGLILGDEGLNRRRAAGRIF